MSAPIPESIKADVDKLLRHHGALFTGLPRRGTTIRGGLWSDEVPGQWGDPQIWPRPESGTREYASDEPERRPVVRTFPAPHTALALKYTERRRLGYAHDLDETLEGLGTIGSKGLESPDYLLNRCAHDRELVGISRRWSAHHWWRTTYPLAWYVPEEHDYREGLMFLDNDSPAGRALARIDRAIAVCMRRKLEYEYSERVNTIKRTLIERAILWLSRPDFRDERDRTIPELLIWRDDVAAPLAGSNARTEDDLPPHILAQINELERAVENPGYGLTT